MRVVVFCASSELTPELRSLARACGDAIGRAGHELVYGGTAMGLMREVAEGARAAGGRVVGVVPRPVADRWTVDEELDELVEVASMGARKEVMLRGAGLVVALPGGIGTLDELLEAMTYRQVGLLPVDLDIALLDPTGVWAPLLEQLDRLVALGALRPELARLRVVTAVEQLLPPASA